MHQPYVPGGAGLSCGLTFREQEEVAKREKMEAKKKNAKKKKAINSKIEKAMNFLREAILLEMDELVEKHKERCSQCKNKKRMR